MRQLVPILLALVFAAPAGSVTTSGLRGTVTEPRPVCLEGDPCGGPTPGVTIVFSRRGRIVKRVTSNREGRYRVSLAPGSYSVGSPDATPPLGRVSPARVRVEAGLYRRVNFFVATGIRAP
jgi:hypothetical protein